MSALICGSIAYDNIMVFEGRFKEHILPDQIHILNVSFLVPDLRREFGGCAGNVAYNLRLLGGEPRIMATVGTDFGPYREWLTRQGVNLAHVVEGADVRVGQARDDARLSPEALHRLRIGVGFVGQELDRDLAPEPQVFGFIHHAHAACAKARQHAVVGNGLADHRLPISDSSSTARIFLARCMGVNGF